MNAPFEIWIAIAGMAAVTYLCRAGGFWVMGLVKLTPRLQGWLAAMPSALFAAILARTLAHSGPIEVAGVVAAFGVARILGDDFAGMLAGIGAVAALRGAWG